MKCQESERYAVVHFSIRFGMIRRDENGKASVKMALDMLLHTRLLQIDSDLTGSRLHCSRGRTK